MDNLPLSLKKEISDSETNTTEFKESYSDRSKIKETMIAFANLFGGRIYIGVKETFRKEGLQIGNIIGVTTPGLSKARSQVSSLAKSFRPRVETSFHSYKEGENRVDVIEIKESNQKPVCSDSGLYKIRTIDGNIGIDPARLREIIMGYETVKTALINECKRNIDLSKAIQNKLDADQQRIDINELSYSSIDIILTNGALLSQFNIDILVIIRNQCIRINKLLDFSITAGDVVYKQEVFLNFVIKLIPLLQKNITLLLREFL